MYLHAKYTETLICCNLVEEDITSKTPQYIKRTFNLLLNEANKMFTYCMLFTEAT